MSVRAEMKYYKIMVGEEAVGCFATSLAPVKKAMQEVCKDAGHKLVRIGEEEYERLEAEE